VGEICAVDCCKIAVFVEEKGDVHECSEAVQSIAGTGMVSEIWVEVEDESLTHG
jgi:hypothetical protein